MWNFLEIGGTPLWLLLACSVVLLGLFFERQIALTRCRVYLHDFLPGLLALLREHRHSEAVQICAATPGPLARVCKTLVVDGRHMDRSNLRDLAEAATELELPHLKRQMPLLSAICYLAPLLGLLGTFLGLLATFAANSANGVAGNSALLTEGLYRSLISATAGLMISIPGFASFVYLNGRIERILQEIRRAAFEVTNVLISAQQTRQEGIIEFHPKNSSAPQ